MKTLRLLVAMLVLTNFNVNAYEENTTRPLKDCIKPGGLIDDDVQMCMNGKREKKRPELKSLYRKAVVNYVLKGTSYEKHMQKLKLQQEKQTLRVTRSLKDCIKPNGLIDDEVQMCVNGTRKKTW